MITDLALDPPEGLTYEESALWKYQRYLEDYLACIASVDDNVGRLIDLLIAWDWFDDTLRTYASDQGFFLGDHGWYDKRFIHEESIRMPMLISYPAAPPAGRRSERMITSVGLARTHLEAADVAPDPGMQGESLFADLRDELEPPQGPGDVLPVLGVRRRHPPQPRPLRHPEPTAGRRAPVHRAKR